MINLVKKITTELPVDDTGTLMVDWDMAYWLDEPSDVHPDNSVKFMQEYRDVHKIRKVHLNNVRHDSPLYNLEQRLLDAVEHETIEDLNEKFG